MTSHFKIWSMFIWAFLLTALVACTPQQQPVISWTECKPGTTRSEMMPVTVHSRVMLPRSTWTEMRLVEQCEMQTVYVCNQFYKGSDRCEGTVKVVQLGLSPL